MIHLDIKELLPVDKNIWITGITDNSKEVKKGYLFVATKGYHVDHFDYIEDAIQKGCVFLVVDKEISFSFPHIVVEEIEKAYKELCIKFYGVDLKKLHLIGITGTDGKTTTATIVKELIKDCAYLGTNGLIIRRKSISTKNTTPCISELYKDFSLIQKECIKTVSMEVSSEALLHQRISNLQFDVVAFTNITGDHMNIHKTLDEYKKCKLKLLELVKENGVVIVNGDDTNLQNIHCQNLYTFGFGINNDYQIKCVKELPKKTEIILYGKEEYKLITPLKGKFNVYNVVQAFLIGLFYGVDKELLLQRLMKIKRISGRYESLNFGQDYDIILDYAHTINAIENILEIPVKGRRIVVTGCAGGRDWGKRPKIGKIIMEKSDVSIFTMDDPRYEKVDDIINQMVGHEKRYIRIPNREEAISYALSIAKAGDKVFILGKGRDNYMAIENKKVPYNDYKVIKNYFQKR